MESPAVERADDLTLLDPTPVERPVRVRAAGCQHMEGPAVEEDSQPEALDLDRQSPALGDVLRPADGDETIHPQGIPGDPLDTERFRTCRLRGPVRSL